MYAQQIKKWMRFLDLKRPGWLKRIKITKLDMDDPKLCILGQEFGDYHDGLDALGIFENEGSYDEDPRRWPEYGLDSATATDPDNAKLDAEWKAAIRKRRAEDKVRRALMP